MDQRIFIKVVGFSDVERHALNTVFRLSEDRAVVYALWTAEAPEPPSMALVDGLSYEGRVEAEAALHSGLRFIWVGEQAPQGAWRTYPRPLAWMDVVHAMDGLFVAEDALDFDLDIAESGPQTLPPTPEPPRRRALIASADRDEQLYMRAKLALAELTIADEAESGAQALELMRTQTYDVALVDFALPDVEGWSFIRQLASSRPAVGQVIVTKQGLSLLERVRGWSCGAKAIFAKPPPPGKLQGLLEKVAAGG